MSKSIKLTGLTEAQLGKLTMNAVGVGPLHGDQLKEIMEWAMKAHEASQVVGLALEGRVRLHHDGKDIVILPCNEEQTQGLKEIYIGVEVVFAHRLHDSTKELFPASRHWTCGCKAIHGLADEACPLCGDRRTDVFRREVDESLGETGGTQ